MLRMFPRKLFSSRSRRTSDQRLEPNRSPSPAGFRRRNESINSDESLLLGDNKHPEDRSTSPTPSSSRSAGDVNSLVPTVGLPARSKSPRADRTLDPLGFTLLHCPEGQPVADVIFIHGLGGSSRLSWSKNKELALFWPLQWLPADPDVRQSRIFTFGYDASFLSPQSTTLGISDFAKNLLYDLLYARDSGGQELRFGQVPTVFVTHSMGGLVFKKAYLDAKLDPRYETIVESIKAVVFLATPHRGADLSEFLNRLLSISFLSSWKQYVSELNKQAPFLRLINDQFRHVAPRLQIFSFYETLQTQVGLTSVTLLDGESAKLGYPAEISRSLNADHHGVCKFDSPQDPNYLVVLGSLKTLIASFADSEATDKEIAELQDLLSLPGNVDHDLDHFWGRRAEGTCEWVLTEPVVTKWVSSSPSTSEVLWVHGRPARGKSVLSSFLVHRLRDQAAVVLHFFFRTGDETKRSIGALLRSLAFQAALKIPSYRQALASLASGGGYKPKEADWKSIWKRLFADLLFQIKFHSPLYWIIDGVDESGSPQHIFELLAEINKSSTPIRVLLTSRWNPSLASVFQRVSSNVPATSLSIDNDTTDMQIYAEGELRYLMWNSLIKGEVRTKILEQANDNFLWVYLVLEEVKDCHTEADVRERLGELPAGMELLYAHMEETIRRIRRPSDKSLARQLLLWAIYARRSIAIAELSAILKPEFGHLLDLSNTINRLCGQFVVLEGNNRVALLHQTAREYLTATSTLPFSLDTSTAHDELFKQSINAFLDKGLRPMLETEPPGILEYRATSWAYHLGAFKNPEESDDRLDILIRFFSQQAVLSWIQVLASVSQLKVLIEASHALHSYVQRKRRADAAREPSLRRFEDLEILEAWSVDLLKLPGKFGSTLSRDPASILTSVAPFCPRSSAIYKTFSQISSSTVRVTGASETWDDRLARVSIGTENQVSLISCSGRHLAVVSDFGAITIWDSATFHQIQLLEHGEPVSSICFDSKGNRLATYGFRTTKIWSPKSGKIIRTIDNPLEVRALCLSFVDRDATLLMGSDHRCVMKASVENRHGGWGLVDAAVLTEVDSLEGTYMNSPTALAISPDGKKIAATFRRFPLTVWSLSSPIRVLRRLKRGHTGDTKPNALPFASRISWHPNSDELLGIFLDGCAFRMNVLDGTYHEQQPDPGQMPADIHCSPDGTVFAIRGMHGTIKLYDYQTWTLIYQLSSEDMITAFCFSQDGRRFYDIRGSCCNIWEPNSLIRLSLADDQAANSSQAPEESVGRSNVASESFADDPSPIVLASPMPRGSLVCRGDEEGLIELVDYNTNKRIHVAQTATRLRIEHLCWSDDGLHFCYSEIGGRVSLIEVLPTETGWKQRRVARFKPGLDGHRITQLLLSSDSTALLVASKESVQLWALNPVSLQQEHKCSTAAPRWVSHPLSKEHVISATPSKLILHRWTDLEEVTSWDILDSEAEYAPEVPRPAFSRQLSQESTYHSENIEETVERVTTTHFQGHIIVTIARRTHSRKLRPRYLIFEGMPVHSHKDGDGTGKSYLTPLSIPRDIANETESPLEILKGERLVYIDRSFGVCEWPLRSSRGVGDVQRHFFIPRDWLPDQDIGLLHITSSGSILCPRKGGITVIQTSLGVVW